MPGYFLVKSEPDVFSYADLERDRSTRWDGVRNFTARNHLRAMKRGDLALYYHTGDVKAVVGVARVSKEAYADPTADEGDWSAVDLEPCVACGAPVTLAAIKADKIFADFALVRQARLSVMPVSAPHFQAILKLSGTKLPK